MGISFKLTMSISRGKGVLVPDLRRSALTHFHNDSSWGLSIMLLTYITCTSQKLSLASNSC